MANKDEANAKLDDDQEGRWTTCGKVCCDKNLERLRQGKKKETGDLTPTFIPLLRSSSTEHCSPVVGIETHR